MIPFSLTVLFDDHYNYDQSKKHKISNEPISSAIIAKNK